VVGRHVHSLRLILSVSIVFVLSSCGTNTNSIIYPNNYELIRSPTSYSIKSTDSLESIINYYDNNLTSVQNFEDWEEYDVMDGRFSVNSKIFSLNESMIYVQVTSNLDKIDNYILVVVK
jgi:hypothetical protein